MRVITMRLEQKQLDIIDNYGDKMGLNRSAALRAILHTFDQGLGSEVIKLNMPSGFSIVNGKSPDLVVPDLPTTGIQDLSDVEGVQLSNASEDDMNAIRKAKRRKAVGKPYDRKWEPYFGLV